MLTIVKSWQKQCMLLGMICLISIGQGAFAADDCNNCNKDPLECFNRVMFKFNDVLDKAIFKPVATVYNKIVPKPVAKGISNMFSNIDMVPTIINDVLQLNFYQAANDSWRLGINSTVGLLGFFDVAAQIGLESNYEDFGLTLAHWGYRNSTFIVLPFLGPSTLRDAMAWPVNYQYMTIYPYVDPVSLRYKMYALSLISRRADLLRFESVFQQAALDKYVFMRDAYLQRRCYLIERNKQLGNPYLDKNARLGESPQGELLDSADLASPKALPVEVPDDAEAPAATTN